MRPAAFALAALLPFSAFAEAPVDLTPEMASADTGSASPDVTRLALGGGLNLAPVDPGWQASVAVMGEDRDRALLTQISAGYEVVGTRRPNDAAPTGRIAQVVLNPLSIFGGFGAVRLGGGFDVSYAFNPVGPAGSAGGWGIGGRAGGGLSLHPGVVNIWMLAQYRWLSGDRVGGVFFDLFIGPD